MSSALVMAARGTGLSTFLGLLYTAQVRLGSDEVDERRFHVDRESIRNLEGVYGDLGAGRFPECEVDWERVPLTFLLGVRRAGLGRGSSGFGDAEFDPYRFEIGGMALEELAELAGRDAVLDAPTLRLLRSPIAIALVDAGRVSGAADGSAAPPLPEDPPLSAALALLQRHRSAERRARDRRLSVLFVLTKSDRLTRDAAQRLGAPATPVAEWDPVTRIQFGDHLLRERLPQTAQRLHGPAPRGSATFARASWFFSSLGVDAVDASRIQRRWRTPGGGWEPEYPFEEYRALLDRLAEIARRLPRDSAF